MKDATIPCDYLCYINGLYYKFGRFNRVYYWVNDEWKNSSHDRLFIETHRKKLSRGR